MTSGCLWKRLCGDGAFDESFRRPVLVGDSSPVPEVESASSYHEPFGVNRRRRSESIFASCASSEPNRGVHSELEIPVRVVDVADVKKPHLTGALGVNRCGCTAMLPKTRLEAPNRSSSREAVDSMTRGCSAVEGGDVGPIRVFLLVRVLRWSTKLLGSDFAFSKAFGVRRRRPRGIGASSRWGRRCHEIKSRVDAQTSRQSMRLRRIAELLLEPLVGGARNRTGMLGIRSH